MKSILVGMLGLLLVFSSVSEAAGRRRSTCVGCQSRVVGSVGGGSAQAKANELARRGQIAHLGGGFGGGSHEGVGCGPTRDSAIRNACYWGQ